MGNTTTFQNSSKITKKTGLRKAVDNHCKSCIYDSSESGTWRKQIEKCSATTCDLYPFRARTFKKAKIAWAVKKQ